jgi:S-adenosylmethionine synthetase
MNSGSVNSIRKEVFEVIDKELANINQFCMDLINGKYKVC